MDIEALLEKEIVEIKLSELDDIEKYLTLAGGNCFVGCVEPK